MQGVAAASISADYGKIMQLNAVNTIPSTIYPGDTVNLNIDLKNRGASFDLKNVEAVIAPSDSFEVIKGTDSLEGIGTSNISTVVFKFKVKESVTPGTYQIPLMVSFNRGDLSAQTEDYNILIDVSGERSVDIKNIQLSDMTPHLGENLRVTASIENNGSLEARNVVVSLARTDQDSLGDIVPLSETTVHLDNISMGATKNVEFNLYLSTDLTPDTYNFEVSVAMLDEADMETESISFEAKGKPDLILGGVDLSIDNRPKDKRLMQGDTFSLSIQLENIGTETAKAVEVHLEVDDGITGMKENYVGNIDEDDSGAAIFDLSIGYMAGLGDHPANVVIKYIDEMDQPSEISKEVKIFINQRPPESPIGYLFLLVILAIVAWFGLKQVNRFLSLRKR
jgi:hypothetical protein